MPSDSSHRPPPLSELTSEQRRAVLWEGGDVHVSGGPGTGKTAVLVRRVEHLITQNVVAPEDVLLLPGTPSTASVLRTVVQTVLPQQGERVSIAPLASTCAELLRHHGDRVDLASFSIYDDREAKAVVQHVMDNLGYGPDSASAEEVWAEIARTKARGRSVDSVTDPLYCDDEIDDVYPAYQSALDRARALDRWGLVQKGTQLLEENDPLLDRYRTHWRHILVEDIQNWASAEWDFLHRLAGPSNHLFVTSDEQQCVRGPLKMESEGSDAFWNDRPGPEHIELTESFRPPRAILRLAASLLDREGEEGGPLPNDSPAVLIEASSETEETRAIAQRIEWLCDENEFAYGDVAVLTRRADEHSVYEGALTEKGIPVQRPTTSPYDDPTEDALAYLHVAVNPHDDVRVLRILNTPSRGIGPKTKERLQAYARESDLSLWAAINEVDEIESLTSTPRRSLLAFRDLMSPFVKQAEENPASTWARDLIEQSGILNAVTRGHTKEHLAREEKVEALLNRLESNASFHGDVATFLDTARLEALRPPSTDRVLLSSIRAERGREFPIVFLPALEDGIFPSATTTTRDALLQNERRTLYVGLTRSQERLFLSWARSRRHDNREEATTRSRFLDALDKRFLRTEEPSRPAAWEPSDDVPSAYQDVNPHYYRNNLRAWQSDPQAAPTPTADDADRIREGLRIEHEKMGPGTVVRTAGEGKERIAVIDFDERGEKKIKLQYAPLTVLGESPS